MNETRLRSGCLSVCICVLMCCNSFVLSQEIPAIDNLSANPGPYAGEITLNWSTPDVNDPNLVPAYSYEFRTDSNSIDEVSWTASPIAIGDVPPLMLGIDVDLDLSVQCANNGSTVLLDVAQCSALLTYSYTIEHPGQTDPFHNNIPFCEQKIIFRVYDSSGTEVDKGKAYTGSYNSINAGIALWTSKDLTSYLCSSPKPYPNFRFEATWEGGSVILFEGSVLASGSKIDTRDLQLCDDCKSIPKPHEWITSGGVYDYNMADIDYRFFVPAGAVGEDVNVILANPVSVPGPDGMSYAVPGAIIAFELESPNDVNLNLPVTVEVNYPEYKLAEYNGLGESSLHGYIYDDANEVWQMLDSAPTVVNREKHSVIFNIERLGLFAVAAETDGDSDGLGDYEELTIGTNPAVADTDGDGVSDGNEMWFTGGDPRDARKVNREDQYAVVRGFTPGDNYYIAARVVGFTEQSDISNNVYVQAADCPVNPDLDCNGTVNLEDFAFLASWWLQDYP